MKKILCLFVFCVCAISINAWDVIVTNTGESVKAKVISVGVNEVKYKKYDNPEGPEYSMLKSDIMSIVYENGSADVFSGKISSSRQGNTDGRYYNKNTHLCLDVDLGSFGVGGFGFGLRGQYDFNDYVSLDFLSVNWQAPFEDPTRVGFVHTMMGVRAFTPDYKKVRGYMNIDMGYTYTYLPYYNGLHGFGIDFGFGIQLCKYVTLGYNLTYNTGSRDLMHAARIGFVF